MQNSILKNPISITAIASISSLGFSNEEVWNAYQSPEHRFIKEQFGEKEEWIAKLTIDGANEISALRDSDSKYKSLDNSVLFAVYASRKAIESAGWSFDRMNIEHGHDTEDEKDFGINIGSSRGATSLFEKFHEEFLQKGKTGSLASPTTTLGNISSWVAHDLQTRGPIISHSITCSTALHALLNGVAWIHSGMVEKFLVGGSEAPLTPFTIAQMKALKIYAKVAEERSVRAESRSDRSQSLRFPCFALDLGKKENSIILGEGASVACLEKGISERSLAIVEGVGYATEVLKHNVSISADAKCFQKSMQMALGDVRSSEVDAIIMHAPGTVKGDMSEYKAIEKVFKNGLPALTTTKWKTGHTFGASGMLSVELAILMLQHQEFVKVPFLKNSSVPKKMNRILINSVGFGGNAVSVLLKKSSS